MIMVDNVELLNLSWQLSMPLSLNNHWEKSTQNCQIYEDNQCRDKQVIIVINNDNTNNNNNNNNNSMNFHIGLTLRRFCCCQCMSWWT